MHLDAPTKTLTPSSTRHRMLASVLPTLGLVCLCACSSGQGGEPLGAPAKSAASPNESAVQDDAGTTSVDAGDGRTSVQRYCDAQCGAGPTCSNAPSSSCFAALASGESLRKLEACKAQGLCGGSTCTTSTASVEFTRACEQTRAQCVNNGSSWNTECAGGPGPSLRDDVLAALTSCFTNAVSCADVNPCVHDTLRSLEPALCDGI
jgi:hypothetical protein